MEKTLDEVYSLYQSALLFVSGISGALKDFKTETLAAASP